jgi:quercetin dioxygenase-like cupin family protein
MFRFDLVAPSSRTALNAGLAAAPRRFKPGNWPLDKLGRSTMIVARHVLVVGAVVLAGCISAAMAQDAHKMVSPEDIQWGPAPPVLPAGAEAAVLFGDPSKEGLFALRVKFPAGYAVPPHTHPVDEVVTVISGTFKLGMGETADASAATPLPAGSFFALPPETAHFASVDEETVVQITTTGPWALTYVNPADDPRKTQ